MAHELGEQMKMQQHGQSPDGVTVLERRNAEANYVPQQYIRSATGRVGAMVETSTERVSESYVQAVNATQHNGSGDGGGGIQL